jgi:serine/threonine protein kinase
MTEMKKKPKILHDKLTSRPRLASSLLIPDITPLGSGTRGVVYASKHPGMVVKLSLDEREVVAAKRLIRMAHPRIVRVYASFPVRMDNDNVVFTYLERMNPLPPERLSAQEWFADNFKGSYHRPRVMLKSLREMIEGGKAPKKYVAHIKDYRSLLISLLDVGEWHRDLKTPNVMLDNAGSLCVTDIGSFTERPLVVVRNPPILYEELNPLVEEVRSAGWPDVAAKLEAIANTNYSSPKVPLSNLGLIDPHHNDSELSDNEYGHYIPEELLRDPAPSGTNWRQPGKHTDIRRQPRPTTDTTLQRWKMNGEKVLRPNST